MAAIDQLDALAAVRDIYARLQLEIDNRKPICVASGKCCHFESYGHRLYVTTLELAAFVVDLQRIDDSLPRFSDGPEGRAVATISPKARPSGPSLNVLPVASDLRQDGCVFQHDNLCSVHTIRPFGCRIFFCDPAATQWQQDQYELFHAELKQLHQRFDVPYFYVEWRSALAALGISG